MKALLTAIALALAAAGAVAEDQQSAEPPPATSATKMDPKALLRFMRAAAGKFVQDLPAGGPTKGTRIVTRAMYYGWYFDPHQYDPERQVYKFGEETTGSSDLDVYRSCKPAGSYVGQNAFGAVARIERTHCEVATVRPTNSGGVRLEGELQLTRAQFRQVQKAGVPLEVEFVVSANGAGEAVEEGSSAMAPTIQSPRQVTGPEWIVYGSVQQVRMILPGGRAQTVYKKTCSWLYPEENDESMGCPKLR